MKPRYSSDDEEKLIRLLGERRIDLLSAMRKFGEERGVPEFRNAESLVLIPALGFKAGTPFLRNPLFAYFLVTGLDQVEMLLPQTAPVGILEIMEGAS
jgi:hypothetical protein